MIGGIINIINFKLKKIIIIVRKIRKISIKYLNKNKWLCLVELYFGFFFDLYKEKYLKVFRS